MDLFFYTSDFFPPQIVSEKGRKVCFSKIIDCHPSKYCSLFSLAFYMRFTPSGNVPKIYFQSNLLNLVNSKSITFSKLAQKVKLLRIET